MAGIKVKRSTMRALRDSGLNGDFIIRDLWSNTDLRCRGAAGNNNHIDFMWARRADFEAAMRLIGKNPSKRVGTWRARPCLIIFTNRNGTFAFSGGYHTKNHSVAVAGSAYNPAGVRITRGQGASPRERDYNGRWRIGEHMCLWVGNSWDMRGNRTSNYELDMRDAVREAEKLAGQSVDTASPPSSTQPQADKANANAARNTEFAKTAKAVSASELTWRVQVSASRNREATEELVALLVRQGFDAYFNHYGGLYRVQVGCSPNRDEVKALVPSLRSFGHDTYVKRAKPKRRV